MRVARWLVTNQCNYRCSYCWERILENHDKFKAYKPDEITEKYFDGFQKLNPEILDITGGEPFIRKGIIQLLSRLSKETHIKLAFTSNISTNLIEFLQNVDTEKVSSFTASFHPEHISERQFLGKLQLMKNYGVRVINVNFVTYPEQLWNVEYYRRFFEDNGFNFHVDIWSIPPDTVKYIRNENENDMLKKFSAPERLEAYQEKHYDKVTCNAGLVVCQITPELDVYPCLWYSVIKKNKIGNLLDKDFVLPDKNIICADRDNCAGCDRDHVSISEVK